MILPFLRTVHFRFCSGPDRLSNYSILTFSRFARFAISLSCFGMLEYIIWFVSNFERVSWGVYKDFELVEFLPQFDRGCSLAPPAAPCLSPQFG